MRWNPYILILTLAIDKHYTYKTTSVCSGAINFDVIDGMLHNVDIVGGCKENTLIETKEVKSWKKQIKNTLHTCRF